VRRFALTLFAVLAIADLAYGQCVAQQRRFAAPSCTPAPVAEVLVPATVVIPTYSTLLIPAFSFQFLPALTPTTPAPAPVSAAPQLTSRSPEAADDDGWPAAATVGAIGANPPSAAAAALAVLRSNCAACHTSPGKAGVSLFDGRGRLVEGVDSRLVYEKVSQKLMPPRRPLSEADIRVIGAWAQSK
jgi:mono/diheme cytochrome c family protein